MIHARNVNEPRSYQQECDRTVIRRSPNLAILLEIRCVQEYAPFTNVAPLQKEIAGRGSDLRGSDGRPQA